MEKVGIGCKKLMAEEIKQKVADSSCLFTTSFQQLPATEQDELRKQLKELDVGVLIIKNRIARKALKGLNQEKILSLSKGLTALMLGKDDPVAVAKTLVDFAGKNENFKVLGGYVDEQIIEPSSIKELSSIPSREILLSQVVAGIASPIQGLVNTLSATIKQFLVVLNRIQENKEK